MDSKTGFQLVVFNFGKGIRANTGLVLLHKDTAYANLQVMDLQVMVCYEPPVTTTQTTTTTTQATTTPNGKLFN